jgi:diguanylate cyclase
MRHDRKPALFAAESWSRVWLWTVLGTLACVLTALAVDSLNYASMSDEQRLRAILTSVVLPIVLAGPLLFFFLFKLRQLAIAHARLTILASTDSLTTVLNRGAFTTLVDAYLTEVREAEREPRGALLVVDADNFKAINDSFGHDRGDEALRLIASSIRSVLRNHDLVGRIGGEEFGVFLPAAGADQAGQIAERIRRSVNEAEFQPDGRAARALSVTVGGAVFERRVAFDDLFRVADQQLYAAKQNGRNRVAIAAPERRLAA